MSHPHPLPSQEVNPTDQPARLLRELVHAGRNALQRSQVSTDLLRVRLADQPALLPLLDSLQHGQDQLHATYDQIHLLGQLLQDQSQDFDVVDCWHQAWRSAARPGDRAMIANPQRQVLVHAQSAAVFATFRQCTAWLQHAAGEPLYVRVDCEQMGRDAATEPASGPHWASLRLCEHNHRWQPVDVSGWQGPLDDKPPAKHLNEVLVRSVIAAQGGRVSASIDEQGSLELVLLLPGTT